MVCFDVLVLDNSRIVFITKGPLLVISIMGIVGHPCAAFPVWVPYLSVPFIGAAHVFW